MYKQYGEALGLETNIMDILTKPCYAPMIVFLALAHLQQKTHFGHSAFRHASKHGGVLFTMATKAMSIAVSDQLTRLQEIAHYTHSHTHMQCMLRDLASKLALQLQPYGVCNALQPTQPGQPWHIDHTSFNYWAVDLTRLNELLCQIC